MATTFDEIKAGLFELLQEAAPDSKPAEPAEPGSLLGDMDIFPISIDGVGLMLLYSASVKNDRMFAFCDFGDVPPEREAAVMRRLLEMNFAVYQGNAPSFTIDPESGRVMLLAEVPLSEATPVNVMGFLQGLSVQANEWRKNHFLAEEQEYEALEIGSRA